jgi:polyketide cyclase/dehydrase/lipid transport protein
MPDRQKVEAILTTRFPGAPLPQVAAAVNAIMALGEDRPGARPRDAAGRTAPRTTIAVSTRINAPLTRVFDLFTDMEHATEYVTGIVGLERLSDMPFGVGFRWRETRRILGRIDSAEMEVTAFQRYRGYTITHHKAGVRVETAFAFEAAAGGTLVEIDFALDGGRMPTALLSPVNWVIAGKVRHVLLADLTDLKAGIEGKH